MTEEEKNILISISNSLNNISLNIENAYNEIINSGMINKTSQKSIELSIKANDLRAENDYKRAYLEKIELDNLIKEKGVTIN